MAQLIKESLHGIAPIIINWAQESARHIIVKTLTSFVLFVNNWIQHGSTFHQPFSDRALETSTIISSGPIRAFIQLDVRYSNDLHCFGESHLLYAKARVLCSADDCNNL
jgi:hypothetical protein